MNKKRLILQLLLIIRYWMALPFLQTNHLGAKCPSARWLNITLISNINLKVTTCFFIYDVTKMLLVITNSILTHTINVVKLTAAMRSVTLSFSARSPFYPCLDGQWAASDILLLKWHNVKTIWRKGSHIVVVVVPIINGHTHGLLPISIAGKACNGVYLEQTYLTLYMIVTC